jgi:phosphoglycolate phosphatase
MTRFVLWDLDGTLIDSGTDIALAANAARVEVGLVPLPHATIKGFVGEGAKRLMEQVVGDGHDAAFHARALECFFDAYGKTGFTNTRPYDGIDRLVRGLAGRQGIATNKPSAFSRDIVARLGWEGLFRSLVGGGDVPNRKPAPDAVFEALRRAGVSKEEAVFVGDSPIDVQTARAAGIDFVAVSWGLRPRHELLDAPAIVDTVDELEEALLRLDGTVC